MEDKDKDKEKKVKVIGFYAIKEHKMAPKRKTSRNELLIMVEVEPGFELSWVSSQGRKNGISWKSCPKGEVFQSQNFISM